MYTASIDWFWPEQEPNDKAKEKKQEDCEHHQERRFATSSRVFCAKPKLKLREAKEYSK